ncbi:MULTISPECIES: protein-disulfide reductase DsbD domain-containing protein [unclassified Aureispira]|uniref:protein-disulfide reductase DsbD domain-containing protein n=1 Tax=unclassified Aureispira TaxID=2649989 RepID=UPI000698B8DC|nr:MULTISPECIES: protein-disulfide reductase DsbD domain-containing protein [unclassified Aureispira]WMX15535.1 protein-disulfide reductase DsbD family protein [Aureispira sp. CCB-E]
MKYLFSILLVTFSVLTYAQNNNTVSWSFESKKTASNEYTIQMKATIKDGWYVYSQYLESDDGPIRTAIVLEENAGVELVGKAEEEGNKVSGFDSLFDMDITKYKKQLIITQKIKASKVKTLKGYITFMTCNDEQCLPPTDVPFEIKLK